MSIMDGEISDNTGKTTLFITLRLHRFVAAFYLLWMISVGSIGGVGLIGSALNGHFEGLFIIPVLMFLFGLFLINFAFKTEKKITLEVFKKMLEIEEDSIDNNSPIQRL